MDEFIKFVNENPTVTIIMWGLGIIGWIVGIVSGVMSIIEQAKKKKIDKGYEELLERARCDWEGKYTEEQVKELTQQFQALKRQIEIDIPKQAKRVVLQKKIDELTESISTSYEEYKDLSSKIEDAGAITELDKSIHSSIQEEILPEHVRNKKQQKRVQIMLVVILILTLAPITANFLLSSSLSHIFVYIPIPIYDLFIYIVGSFASIILVYNLTRKFYKRILKIRQQRILSIILSISFLLLWILIVYEIVFEPIELLRYLEIVGAVISMVPLSIGSTLLFSIVRKKYI